MRFFPELRTVRWRAVARRVHAEVVKDDLSGTAAQLAYYFLFSLFPSFIVLVSLAAFLPIEDAAHTMGHKLGEFMPKSAMDVVHENLHALIEQPRPKLLGFGILVTLWTSSRGVDALRKGLNLAYDVPESRPAWRTQLTAVGITVAGAILALIAFAAVVFAGRAGELISARLHIEQAVATAYAWASWPLAAVAIMIVFALSYYLLPDVKQQFRFITPGSIFASIIWLGGTWGLTQYVEHFGRFNVAYGSIGGVIVLLLWLYLTAFAVLLGGELNAAIEHESKEGKRPGAREEGQAPLPPEERPSAAPPAAAKKALDESAHELKH